MSWYDVRVIAKVPRIHRSKTRLASSIGAERAASLARAALLDVLAQHRADAQHVSTLCFSPEEERHELIELLKHEKLDTYWTLDAIKSATPDCGFELTEILEEVVAKCSKEVVVLLGMDCVELSAIHVNQTACTARDRGASLIRARDGGYVCLAMQTKLAAGKFVFQNIAWSTNHTAEDQLGRLKQCGIDVTVNDELVLDDLDTIEDLKMLYDRVSSDQFDSDLRPLRVIEFIGEQFRR